MIYITILLVTWLLYVYSLRKRNKEEFAFSLALLPLLLFSMITYINLEVNYLMAAIPSLNDGISARGFAWYLIKDYHWSFATFRLYADYSLLITLVLLLIYMISYFIEKRKTPKNNKEVTNFS